MLFSAGVAVTTAQIPCQSMHEYVPADVIKNYDMDKHNGTWYEVAFRDLYPAAGAVGCYCQQSVKYVHKDRGFIDDYFVFTCGPDVAVSDKYLCSLIICTPSSIVFSVIFVGSLMAKLCHLFYPILPYFYIQVLNYISPQVENITNGGTGERHQNGVYDMYVRDSKFKFITHYEWNSAVIGYHDDGQDQYKWVIEFQCGTRPDLPPELCLGKTSKDGKCVFTGIQMYVRDYDFMKQGRDEMINYVRTLGPNATQSLGVAWVMGPDFAPGTFPPFFVNTTYEKEGKILGCHFPCKSGCWNEERQSWGCCPLKNTTKDVAPLATRLS